MQPDDLVARARELGAPMHAPEPGIARRSELLLALAGRVEELEQSERALLDVIDNWAERCVATEQDRDRRAARVEALEGLLKGLEWEGTEWDVGGTYPRAACPECGALCTAGHRPGCRLARALGKEASDG